MRGLRVLVVGVFALSCSAAPGPAPAAPGPPAAPRKASHDAPRQCVDVPRHATAEPTPQALSEPLAVYEERAWAQPSDPAALFNLLLAYERERHWGPAATTALRLSRFAPNDARYRHRQGLNLVRAAEAGNRDLFAAAREPLEKCIERDPGFADCHFLLGEVAVWGDDEELAQLCYRRAIGLDPMRAEYYLRLAELYSAHQLEREVVRVLNEALRALPAQGEQATSRVPVLIELADQVARHGDGAHALGYLAQAEPLAQAGPAALSYELAAAYVDANLVSADEQQQTVAKLMKRFFEHACGDKSTKQDKERCSVAAGWVQRFP